MADNKTTNTEESEKKQTTEEYINKMYDTSLEQEKAGLKQNYDTGMESLDQASAENTKAADEALGRTYVEAQKAAKNYAEVQNAYGLTSGAMAQARMAQDNQLQADMTAIRTAQQEADAQIERERALLAQQYTAAINAAQADNDMARAQALYEAAQADDAALFETQKEIAMMLAEAGDYSMMKLLYGLTDQQVAALSGEPVATPTGPAFIGGMTQPGVLPSENTYDANDARPAEIGYEVPTAQPGEVYGVATSTLEELGYGDLPSEAIADLVKYGYLEEYTDRGVLKWRITAKGLGADGKPLAPNVILAAAVKDANQ